MSSTGTNKQTNKQPPKWRKTPARLDAALLSRELPEHPNEMPKVRRVQQQSHPPDGSPTPIRHPPTSLDNPREASGNPKGPPRGRLGVPSSRGQIHKGGAVTDLLLSDESAKLYACGCMRLYAFACMVMHFCAFGFESSSFFSLLDSSEVQIYKM